MPRLAVLLFQLIACIYETLARNVARWPWNLQSQVPADDVDDAASNDVRPSVPEPGQTSSHQNAQGSAQFNGRTSWPMPGVPPPTLSPVRSLSSSEIITVEAAATLASEAARPAHASRASAEPPQQQQYAGGARGFKHAAHRDKRESDASDSSWLSTDDPIEAERFSKVCTQYTSLYPVRTQLTRIMIKIPDREPEDLKPGWQQLLADEVVRQGGVVRSMLVRKGCTQLLLTVSSLPSSPDSQLAFAGRLESLLPALFREGPLSSKGQDSTRFNLQLGSDVISIGAAGPVGTHGRGEGARDAWSAGPQPPQQLPAPPRRLLSAAEARALLPPSVDSASPAAALLLPAGPAPRGYGGGGGEGMEGQLIVRLRLSGPMRPGQAVLVRDPLRGYLPSGSVWAECSDPAESRNVDLTIFPRAAAAAAAGAEEEDAPSAAAAGHELLSCLLFEVVDGGNGCVGAAAPLLLAPDGATLEEIIQLQESHPGDGTHPLLHDLACWLEAVVGASSPLQASAPAPLVDVERAELLHAAECMSRYCASKGLTHLLQHLTALTPSATAPGGTRAVPQQHQEHHQTTEGPLSSLLSFQRLTSLCSISSFRALTSWAGSASHSWLPEPIDLKNKPKHDPDQLPEEQQQQQRDRCGGLEGGSCGSKGWPLPALAPAPASAAAAAAAAEPALQHSAPAEEGGRFAFRTFLIGYPWCFFIIAIFCIDAFHGAVYRGEGFSPLCLALKVFPYFSVLLFGFGHGDCGGSHSGGSCGGHNSNLPQSRLALAWRWVARDNFGIVMHCGHILSFLMQFLPFLFPACLHCQVPSSFRGSPVFGGSTEIAIKTRLIQAISASQEGYDSRATLAMCLLVMWPIVYLALRHGGTPRGEALWLTVSRAVAYVGVRLAVTRVRVELAKRTWERRALAAKKLV